MNKKVLYKLWLLLLLLYLSFESLNDSQVECDGKPLEDVNNFMYLGSKLSNNGDSIVDIKARISKANQSFAMLRNIWRSKVIKIHTKMKLFRSNVLSVLLYGSEFRFD